MDKDQFKYCGLRVALTVLSGKWKPVILFHLFNTDEIRFTELWRAIPKVSKKVLLDHLRQMEEDGLIIREEKHSFPPEVSYRIAGKGRALGAALAMLETWANEYARAKVDCILKGEKRFDHAGE